jgi:hypothetical protein
MRMKTSAFRIPSLPQPTVAETSESEKVFRFSPFEFDETSELAQGLLSAGNSNVVSRAFTVSQRIVARTLLAK